MISIQKINKILFQKTKINIIRMEIKIILFRMEINMVRIFFRYIIIKESFIRNIRMSIIKF